jgi:hypothetical protein
VAVKYFARDDAKNAKLRADSGVGLAFAAAIVIVEDDYFERRSRGRLPPVDLGTNDGQPVPYRATLVGISKDGLVMILPAEPPFADPRPRADCLT